MIFACLYVLIETNSKSARVVFALVFVCLSLILYLLSVCISPSVRMYVWIYVCVWVALWGREVFMLHRASICLSCNNLSAPLLATIRPPHPITLSHSLLSAARTVEGWWDGVNGWLQHLENINREGRQILGWLWGQDMDVQGQVKGIQLSSTAIAKRLDVDSNIEASKNQVTKMYCW